MVLKLSVTAKPVGSMGSKFFIVEKKTKHSMQSRVGTNETLAPALIAPNQVTIATAQHAHARYEGVSSHVLVDPHPRHILHNGGA